MKKFNHYLKEQLENDENFACYINADLEQYFIDQDKK